MSTEKQKILLLSGDYYLEGGGIQNTSFLFADYFRKYFKVYALCPKDGHAPNIDDVTTVKSAFRMRALLYSFDYIRLAFRLIKKEHIDYLLAVHFSNAVCCLFMKWFLNIPYGVLAHGEEVVKRPQKGAVMTAVWSVLVYPMRYLIFKYADDIFANTNFTKGLVEQITSNRQITIINPPISTMPEKRNWEVNKNSFMLSVGRLEDRKGFQHVIEAVLHIKEVKPDIRYVLAGGGPYGTHLKQLVKENSLESYVDIRGRISEEEKEKLLKECSLFLMPSCKIEGKSSIEGFGLSLLEANSFGKFVISTVSGGIPEAVVDGKTGFLVEENNVNALAQAILKYYSNDFTYNTEDCVTWAEKRFITNISRMYFEQISKTITKEQ